ncbi:CD1871A family CXXC motif-containing protein [Peptoniphilaceae bacterium SGI.131]
MRNAVSFAIFLSGIGLVLFGVLAKQENLIVLNKAIRICMECIGIG